MNKKEKQALVKTIRALIRVVPALQEVSFEKKLSAVTELMEAEELCCDCPNDCMIHGPYPEEDK